MFRIKKSFARIIQLVLLISIIYSCGFEKPVDKSFEDFTPIQKEQLTWLSEEANFHDSLYKQTFNLILENAIQNEDLALANEAFYRAFEFVGMNGYGQSFYTDKLKKYLDKYDHELPESARFTLNNHMGMANTFYGKFDEAINYLNKVAQLTPTDDETTLDYAYACYYLSYCYANIGDYNESLKTANKSLEAFQKIQYYDGEILIRTQIAFNNFAVYNIDEAIASMDKILELKDKIQYPNSVLVAMLSKYDFLLFKENDKADDFLDSIGWFIQEHDIQNSNDVVHYTFSRFKQYYTKNMLHELDSIYPILERQVQELNIDKWNYIFESAKARYSIKKYKQIRNRDEILRLKGIYEKNNNYLNLIDIFTLFKDEAKAQNDLNGTLQYIDDIREVQKQMDAEALRFKVSVFEKQLDAEKKERIIEEQNVELAEGRFYLVLLCSIFMISAISSWILVLRNKKRKAIEENRIQVQFTNQLMENTEEERSRIANELHDSVNHELLTIKNNLTKGNNIQAEDIGKVIEEVRNISRNLHPAILEKLGLEASIEHLCDKLTESGLFTTCEIAYSNSLTKNKELQLYRIIQEALNNTLKHGKANAAKVILTAQDNYLHLEIKDNGRGFNVHEQLNNPKSFGLQSIMQRAKAILGKVNINSSATGTIILIKIPV